MTWSMDTPFAVIRFTGADAADFLQGQLTQDVRELESAGARLAAWCNPQGRVLVVARLVALEDGIGLAVPASLADALIARFSLYRLRSRVEFAADASVQALATADAGDLARLEQAGLRPAPGERTPARRAHGVVALAPGGAAGFVELYGRAADLERAGVARPLDGAGWQRALVEAGVPTVLEATREKYTPHMLNLDRLGAVSFSKGCYTGQEVVARTEHLGRVKRRIAGYRLDGGTAAPGDRVLEGDREVGEVVNAAGDRLLAVVPVELHAATLAVNGRPALPLQRD
ncbi:MAG TPA: hypothetical protein VKZ85_02640 [Woeseiaceae bacterium]|nr:hypothetical protein [Woeseiaceae bacterium]